MPQEASGTFRGVTDQGIPIVLSISEEGGAFFGHGTLANAPVAITGVHRWSAVGTLTNTDGSFDLLEANLSADGEVLTVQRTGGPVILLTRESAPAPSAGGPFAGRYVAEEGQVPLAEATILQAGSLIAGVGRVFGESAGISGQVVGPRQVDGILTFQDESQVGFAAELSADGGTVKLTGLGAPVILRRT